MVRAQYTAAMSRAVITMSSECSVMWCTPTGTASFTASPPTTVRARSVASAYVTSKYERD